MMNGLYLSRDEIILALKKGGYIREGSILRKVNQGLVHEVYQIRSNRDTYFLKIRLDHFASDASIRLNPRDIEIERRAIQVVNGVEKNFAPTIISSGNNYLLLEHVAGESVYEILLNQELSEDQCKAIASRMKLFHERMAKCDDVICSDEEEKLRYASYLYWRFGMWNHPQLNRLVSDLEQAHRKQLIYGDFNPHNMRLCKNELRIFDLETVHKGNTLFDVGFFLGHLFFHYLDDIERLCTFTGVFQKEYGFSGKDEAVLSKIIIGTIFYRLKSTCEYRVAYAYQHEALLEEMDEVLRLEIASFDQLFARLSRLRERHSNLFSNRAPIRIRAH